MKRLLAVLILSIFFLNGVAQNPQIMRSGMIKDGDNIILSYPSTSISVNLLIEKTTVTPGVYARYTQKYLTLRAPLVAQTTYKIMDASLGLAPMNYNPVELTPEPSITKHLDLPIDQYSSTILSADDAARDAANAIFTIRRQRRDIINGEAGEGYYGEGLQFAIERLDQMEQEYLELFLGSTVITQSVTKYVFNPTADATRYVVARFDSKAGLMPASDLTGAPVYIQFAVQGFPDTSAIEVKIPEKRSKTPSEPVQYRVAAQTQCTLYNDAEQITTAILPIYELGKDIQIEAIHAK